MEATVIGEFTNSGKVVLEYKGSKIMDLDMEFLHNGLLKHQMKTSLYSLNPLLKGERYRPFPFREGGDEVYTKDLENLLADKNTRICFVSEQYDHEVQGLLF